jgi:hypothetical protein
MNQRFMKLCTAAGLAFVLANLVAWTNHARADFVFRIGDASDMLNFNKATGVTSFTGTAGGVTVSFATGQKVDVASGNATISPNKDDTGPWTTLTAVPMSGANFTDFSTRGQLPVDGSVTLIVIDQNNNMFSHTFTGLQHDKDFGGLEAIAVAGSGETIKSVEVSTDASGGFKMLKQEAFGFNTASVPEPSSVIMLAVPTSLFALVTRRRRMRG